MATKRDYGGKKQQKLMNFVGNKYGKLTVIEELAPTLLKDGRKLRYAKCSCECGKEKISTWSNLRSGKINHCGCESNKHGGCNTKLYGVWRRIKQCCFDKNYQAYKNYGQRGISVCDEWLLFVNFREWAIKSGYEQGLSIDRIDNNGNYEPNNCRWATSKEQGSNKRNNVYVEHDGKLITATEFARLTNTAQSTVLYRIHKERKNYAN
jgi:hypothetical protein